MLSVDLRTIVQAEVIPWEGKTYGVAYKTKDGIEQGEPVGSKSEAEAIVRRVAMNLNTSSDELGIFPRDTAVS